MGGLIFQSGDFTWISFVSISKTTPPTKTILIQLFGCETRISDLAGKNKPFQDMLLTIFPMGL